MHLKKEAINHNWVKNHGCSLPKNIHVVTYLFVACDSLLKLFQGISFVKYLSELIDCVAIKFRFGQTFLQK